MNIARSVIYCAVSAVSMVAASARPVASESNSVSHSYIVRASSSEAATQAVLSVGSKTVRNLSLIHAVTADLTPEQVRVLSQRTTLKLFADRPVAVRGLLSSVGTAVEIGRAHV